MGPSKSHLALPSRPPSAAPILPLSAPVRGLISASARFPALADVVESLARWSLAHGATHVSLEVDLASSLVACSARPWRSTHNDLRQLLLAEALFSNLAQLGSLVAQTTDARGRRHLAFASYDDHGRLHVSVDEGQGPLEASSTTMRITLRDLFASLPVRQRLLADATPSRAELAQSRRALLPIALAHPGVDLSLVGREAADRALPLVTEPPGDTGKRSLLDVRSTHSFASRFADIHGMRLPTHELAAEVPISSGGRRTKSAHIRGFVALELQSQREVQHVFVNHRYIVKRDAGPQLVAALQSREGGEMGARLDASIDGPAASPSRWARDVEDPYLAINEIFRQSLVGRDGSRRSEHPCFVLSIQADPGVDASRVLDALRRVVEEALASHGLIGVQRSQAPATSSSTPRTGQSLTSHGFVPTAAANKGMDARPSKRQRASLSKAISIAASAHRRSQEEDGGERQDEHACPSMKLLADQGAGVSHLVRAAYDAASYPHLSSSDRSRRPATSALETGRLRNKTLRGRDVRPATSDVNPNAPREPPGWLQSVLGQWESPALPGLSEPPIPVLGCGGEGSVPSLTRRRGEDVRLMREEREQERDAQKRCKVNSSQGRQGRFFASASSGEQRGQEGLQHASLRREMLRHARVLQQVDGKFIAAVLSSRSSSAEGGSDAEYGLLVLVDQHAADERIRFERILDDYVTACLDKEASAPHTLHQPLDLEAALLSQNPSRGRAALSALCSDRGVETMRFWGFEIRRQERGEGGPTLTAVPEALEERLTRDPRALLGLVRELGEWMLAKGDEAEQVVGWLSERFGVASQVLREPFPSSSTSRDEEADFAEEEDGVSERRSSPSWLVALPHMPRRILDLLSTRACRGSIMFNDDLDVLSASRLLDELGRTRFPFQCAHGRPTVVPLARFGRGGR